MRREILRSLAPPVGVLVAWGLVSAAFTEVSRSGGMLTPEGGVDPMVLAVGAAAVVTRLAALFVALPVLGMRVVVLLRGR